MRFFFGALIFLTLSGCGASLGDRIDSKNLHVYYMDGVSAQEAVNFATYWRDNGFVGEKKQTIQLIKNEYGELLVKLIEDKKYELQGLSLDEQAMLSKLSRTLEKEVFSDTKVRVVPCDNTFRPLVKQ
ncbi:hypothetical protein [Lishizhenia sp.]|uniref:hypothetical protein n=1 Tax=Lishizhenia sp. TaxID=2497594 RepID=UPI00299EC171|nr:hypothetical protein [Lishizhenia sp.]MDX1445105.1 hypothetical protein [Lishizhenia sp.]